MNNTDKLEKMLPLKLSVGKKHIFMKTTGNVKTKGLWPFLTFFLLDFFWKTLTNPIVQSFHFLQVSLSY